MISEWRQFRERLVDHLTWCQYQEFDKIISGALLLQLDRIEREIKYIHEAITN